MLATLGYVAAEFIQLPGDIHHVSSFEAHKVFVESGAMVRSCARFVYSLCHRAVLSCCVIVLYCVAVVVFTCL